MIDKTFFKNPVGHGFWTPGDLQDLSDEELETYGKGLWNEEELIQLVQALSEAAGKLARYHAYLREIRERLLEDRATS